MIDCFLREASHKVLTTLLLGSASVSALAGEQVEVADELARLAETHGFAVRGLDQTEESLGRAEGDELFPRLRRLLENFDHVIVQSPAGGVDRVIVLGEKVPFVPEPPRAAPADSGPGTGEGGDIVLQTDRRGTQHLVKVSLGAKGGSRVERELQVDTGADYLVLPRSLLSKLGVDEQALEERDVQTANGKVKARIGRLASIWLGESQVTDVETAFLEDDKLGSGGLLGMSVLRRYKLTIDDENNRITLGSTRKGKAAAETDDKDSGLVDEED